MESTVPLTTPVLLLTFNRPDLTRQVLGAIREARPTRLFVASDGPREHVESDVQKVSATRALIDEMIDWPCKVERRYSRSNQGCRVGVSSAITWFFDHVEEGIILEDDCLPHPDFFPYCTELLSRYRHDARVMSISGENSVGAIPEEESVSYSFVREPSIWGWATWRSAWALYDANLESWRTLRENRSEKQALWPDPVERNWWTKTLDDLLIKGTPNSWAYRWMFSVMLNDGVSVLPAVNLVSNVGFRSDATHTLPAIRGKRHVRQAVPTMSLLPLSHPANLQRNASAELLLFDFAHGGHALRSPARRLVRRFKALVPRRVKVVIQALLERNGTQASSVPKDSAIH